MACFYIAKTCWCTVAGAPSVATTDVRRQWPSRRAAPVDVADEAAALQPSLVSLRTAGCICPRAGLGVRGIKEPFAQELAIVLAGVGDIPAEDLAEPSVNPGTSAWEPRVGSAILGKAPSLLVQLRAASLDRPQGIEIFPGGWAD